MAKKKEATLLLRIKTAGEKKIDALRKGLNKVGKAGAAAFAAITAAGVKAVFAYKEQEQAVNKLNQSLVTQGVFTSKLSKDYQKMASELQKASNFGDEAIISAQSLMQSYLGQEKISKDLMKATLDLAAATGQDLKAAVEQIGETVSGAGNPLAKYNIQVDASASKQQRLGKVVDQLKGKFDGAAAAQADGLGALNQFSMALGDLFEVVGKALAPAVNFFTKQLTELVTDLQENKEAIRSLEGGVQFISEAFIGLRLVLETVWKIMSTQFQAFSTFLSNLLNGEVRAAINGFVDTWKKGAADIKENFLSRVNDMDAIEAKFSEKRKARLEKDNEELNKAQAERNRRLAAEAQFRNRMLTARSEDEIARQITDEQAKSDQQLIALQQRLDNETTHTAKLDLELQKRRRLDELYAQNKAKLEEGTRKNLQQTGIQITKETDENLTKLGNMQQSKSKAAAATGKAAAIANVGIETADAAMGAMKWGTDVAGPALGFPLAGAVTAFGIAKAAEIGGIQLAEGGVVPATPGGVNAIIAEGGRDEAVIPLDDAQRNLGTTINLTVRGGFLGDEMQAKEWAREIDARLFELRQSNESIAFDQGVI